MKPSDVTPNLERHEQAFFARQFIVAAAGVIYWAMSRQPGVSAAPFIPILLAVLLNVLYYALAAKRVFYPAVKWIQIPLDLLLWTWLIHLSGGYDSVFYPLYAFEIMLSAVALSVAGCIYASVLSCAFYSLQSLVGPESFSAALLAPRLALFAGTGGVCTLLIHKLRLNERIVRRLNEQLRHDVHVAMTEQDAIVTNMTSGLVGVDAEGNITIFNRSAEEITGFKADDVHGVNCAQALGSDNPICRKILGSIGRGCPPDEVEVECRTGTRIKRIAMSCFLLPAGFPTRCVCVIQDRTELRDLEQRTIRAETLSGLGTMAATIAHELRTPLTAIAGFAAILRERLAGAPEDAEMAEKIERGVTSLATITRQLLAFTETPTITRQRVELGEVLVSAMDLIPERARSAVELSVDGSESPLYVEGDKLQLRQAVLNLLSNACDSAGHNGEVAVTLRRCDGAAIMRVSDSGPGVPEDLRTKIFLPFFTTKKGGTGLGLSLSEKLIRAHGGQLTLTSPSGGGAVFTVSLPVAASAGQDAQPAQDADTIVPQSVSSGVSGAGSQPDGRRT